MKHLNTSSWGPDAGGELSPSLTPQAEARLANLKVALEEGARRSCRIFDRHKRQVVDYARTILACPDSALARRRLKSLKKSGLHQALERRFATFCERYLGIVGVDGFLEPRTKKPKAADSSGTHASGGHAPPLASQPVDARPVASKPDPAPPCGDGADEAEAKGKCKHMKPGKKRKPDAKVTVAANSSSTTGSGQKSKRKLSPRTKPEVASTSPGPDDQQELLIELQLVFERIIDELTLEAVDGEEDRPDAEDFAVEAFDLEKVEGAEQPELEDHSAEIVALKELDDGPEAEDTIDQEAEALFQQRFEHFGNEGEDLPEAGRKGLRHAVNAAKVALEMACKKLGYTRSAFVSLNIGITGLKGHLANEAVTADQYGLLKTLTRLDENCQAAEGYIRASGPQNAPSLGTYVTTYDDICVAARHVLQALFIDYTHLGPNEAR